MQRDFSTLETEYVTSGLSYAALGKKHGVSASTIGSRAQREGWGEKRRAYRAEVKRRTLAACAREDEDRLLRLRAAADEAVRTLEEVFSDRRQFYRHLFKDKDPDAPIKECLLQKADLKALRDAVAVLRELTAAQRDLCGLPNARDQAAIETARERLLLARQRAGATPESETGVVVLPEVPDLPESEEEETG